MFDLLTTAGQLHPVEGNAGGSYLTMRSQGGGYIGLIFFGAGFSAAVDSQLFQKAIAADPTKTLGGYLIGGSAWFTVPFVLATTFGLTAAATEHLPSFPTYPNRMNAAEVSYGMAMPYAALAVMGNGGAFAVLLMVFMAVTSAMSSETLATVALFTYDFYQAYINPGATGKQLVAFSHNIIFIFGIFTAAIAVGFNHAGFSVNYLVTAIGIIVDSAIIPMACTIMWAKQSKTAVIAAPLLSSAAAIAAWLGTAYTHFGSVTIATTSRSLPLVAGNMMSLCGPLVLTPLLTFLFPNREGDYEWELLKGIKQADDAEIVVPVSMIGSEEMGTLESQGETKERDENILLRARRWAIVASVCMTLAYLILWPIPMYGTSYSAFPLPLLPFPLLSYHHLVPPFTNSHPQSSQRASSKAGWYLCFCGLFMQRERLLCSLFGRGEIRLSRLLYLCLGKGGTWRWRLLLELSRIRRRDRVRLRACWCWRRVLRVRSRDRFELLLGGKYIVHV